MRLVACICLPGRLPRLPLLEGRGTVPRFSSPTEGKLRALGLTLLDENLRQDRARLRDSCQEGANLGTSRHCWREPSLRAQGRSQGLRRLMKQALGLQAPHINLLMFLKAVVLQTDYAASVSWG